MEYDLGKMIVRYAEKRAMAFRSQTWAVVQDFLSVGSTSCYEFCREHLPKIGWMEVDDEMPDNTLVFACEQLGDRPQKMRRKGKTWYNTKGEELLYSPKWWKRLPR